jgi:hypothetical protein
MPLLRRTTHTLTAWAILVLAFAGRASADTALDELARAVERTESLRAVLNLQRLYAHYAQAGRWNDVAALFASDGRFVFDGLIKAEQTAKGPVAIAAFLRSRYGGGYDGLKADGLSTTMIDAPVANLSADGASAKVRWETWTFHGAGGQARVEGGVFENEYVRQGSVWKIAEAHYYPEFDGDYDTGWTNWGGGNLPVVPRHYSIDTSGTPIAPPIGPAPKSSATLAALQARVDRLNDEDRVRNLQSAYGFYQDRKMWDDVVDLFAEEGKAAVRRSIATMGPAGLRHGQLNDRVQFDVIVEVAPSGNEAWARGIELGMLGEADQEQGWWEITTFLNRFVKDGGVWKLRELRRVPLMKADVFQGWGKGRTIAGVEVPPFLGAPAATSTPAARAATATVAEVRRRLARSEAFDGVMNVSAAYGHFLDDEHPGGFIGVLATKGFKGGRTGYYVTRASNLRARVQRDPPTTRQGISYHWLIQPVVLISDDGRSATARLRLFQPRTGKTVGKAGDFFAASVLASTYHDRYVLEDGIWRIWELTVDPQYITPVAFKDGIWAKSKDPVPPDPNARPRAAAPGRAFRNDITAEDLGTKPDRVQWPSIKPMWFGYRNPVSGRVPELFQPDCVPCAIRPDLKFSANGYQETPDAPAANRAP